MKDPDAFLREQQARTYLRKAVVDVLDALGEDPDRPGLLDTPRRVSDMWLETLRSPYEGDDDPKLVTTFPRDTDGLDCDQMVIVRDIPFVSFCEHHMLPFLGVAHVGYIPGASVLGLSKFARVVEHFARGLQVQERLTAQVASFLMEKLAPQGVCVLMQAEHTCMSIRGVRAPGHRTTTHAIRGAIDKAEFLELLRV